MENIEEINIEDSLYPKALKEIHNPPEKLYVLGNKNLLKENCLSIIGSRKATDYGITVAERFSQNLAKQGICIVSGMAEGIDSAAHLGAIQVRGKTIAVLGSGFNHIFPDRTVFDEILKNNGAVITEYKRDVKVFSDGFRQRNRIVAGLSVGTLVIEAKEKSGTSITAEYAKKFGRHIFCIPHLIEDKNGVGTNRLLKNGAKLVTDITDITKYFNIEALIKTEINVPKEYLDIYNLIGATPINANEIARSLGKNIIEINTTLTMLELEGYIQGMPGNSFVRKE